ncbi:MAG: DUF1320 domain-containing protein [Thermodesulfovibrionia bacterium]|nr:DUF1320 domain-containing protein [Thermodesulfovibrionia bacterium]
MAYCNEDDIKKRIPEQVIIELTDDNSADEIDPVKVLDAIASAEGEINGYLRSRYTLPLLSIPDLIRKLSVDIAIYYLYARKVEEIPDTRRTMYKDAINTLQSIAAGRVVLDIVEEDDVPDPDFTSGVVKSTHFGKLC